METPAWPVNGLLQGRYRIRELLGRGGMGAVFLARDEFLGRDVAVKIFAAGAVEEDFHRQEAEVNVLASFNHHSLVTLLDAAVDRTQPGHPRIYFVMELVGGLDLKNRLEKKVPPLTEREIAEIGYDIAEGLQYIHHRGVVHRDLKPANILLVDYKDCNGRARAKLTDFGVALRTNTERVTTLGLTTGTAAYLSPEQVEQHPVDTASDVYSLGLVLLECFTGEVAFPGEPLVSAIARLRHGPTIPSTLNTNWQILLAAMTARNPRERPTADDLVHALREAVITESGRHRTTETETAVAAARTEANFEANEAARRSEMRRYDSLVSAPDETFDRITAIAARVLGAPISLVSFIDEDRIWFKSHHGLSQIENDKTFANELGLKFYVAVPLVSRNGYTLGTLSVLDFEPRAITDEQLATLTDLAAVAVNELDLRLESQRVLNLISSETMTLGETMTMPGTMTMDVAGLTEVEQ
jgi:serine/threonine protein kinase